MPLSVLYVEGDGVYDHEFVGMFDILGGVDSALHVFGGEHIQY